MNTSIQQTNFEILDTIRSGCEFINQTNSSKDKLRRLDGWYNALNITENEKWWIRWALLNTYSPYIKFGVTSEQVKKWVANQPSLSIFSDEMDVMQLLEHLANRSLTGHNALEAIYNTICNQPENCREVLYNILDKNLKIRMDAKSINKVIPDLIPIFEVSLCNVYFERQHKVDFQKDMWLASRKLDGCRCITIIDHQGDIRFFSRQGKEFFTLDNIGGQLQRLGMQNTVFDGEMCIVDSMGNENFKAITKEITRKNHTIQNPRYKVFDMMTLDEFKARHTDRKFLDRYKELLDWELTYNQDRPEYCGAQLIQVVEMVVIENKLQFQERFNEAQAKGWEGLVIRKNDTTICKRSDSMLKVKAFKDAEYVVEDVEFGPFRVIKDGKEVEEEVMTNAYITHKGNRVSVGSGWSLEQRRQYKEHPEELIGKTITVQYFEETTDKDGNISLRFPTCKFVYENGRNV